MVLSEKDGQLFYELWFPLLDFVNKKYKINKKLKNIANAQMLNPIEVREIADFLWTHVDVIDEYLETCVSGMPEEHRQIVAGWKNCLSGKFVMERHLKKGSIFISGEDEKVYQVQGIISTWKEMFLDESLPILIEATLIPFRDVIISDGLVSAYPVIIGKNISKQLKDTYMEAKKNGAIIRTLDCSSDNRKKKANKLSKSWKAFKKLQNKCYENLAGMEMDDSCWKQSFELFKDLVLEARKQDPSYASRIDILDDLTDYEFNFQGWLDDCLDEIDMSGDFETVLKICDDLLTLFAWPGYTGSDIKFHKVSTLGVLGRTDEVQKFCKEWLRMEPGNIVAATAGVYVFMDARDFAAAEVLVNRFIGKDTECSFENDMMFIAASRLYQLMGKRREQKRVEKKIQKYEEELKQYFMGGDFDDEDNYGLDFLDDDDLPFS